MITDVLKVPGNYAINTTPGGSVTLDVGNSASGTGTVIVNGNLQVLGVQTTIESINATVKDNIIILNSGEPGPGGVGSTGSGITAIPAQSGILIDRGFNADPAYTASFIYDDTFNEDEAYGAGFRGIWRLGQNYTPYGRVLETSGLFLPISNTSTINYLTLLGPVNPTSILYVGGYTRGTGNNYEDRVSATNDPDAIPNKQYVDNIAGSATLSKELRVGNSFVKLQDNSISNIDPYYNVIPQLTVSLGTGTNKTVLLMQGTNAKFASLTLAGNQIQLNTGTTSTSIVLAPGNGNVVQVQSSLQIQKTTAPVSTASYTGIYSTSTVGGGGTGLFFVNTNNTDELVSRRRSIVYSIIF